MNDINKVVIKRLSTGVPRLDNVLGGGLPEFSFNLIAGEPGSGKTTLVHQILFANASEQCQALYFTVLGEPLLKMLRYQQQFSFFNAEIVNKSIHFLNLSEDALHNDLGQVLESVIRKVERHSPRIVVIDSFRTLIKATTDSASDGMSLTNFMQRLVMHLIGWQATTFLVGEYSEREMQENPIFTIADGILVLSQNVVRNSMVRKLQVLKMRGQAPQPGLHTIRINDKGIQIFPRMIQPIEELQSEVSTELISTGVTGLDEMMSGGTLKGNSLLIAGPSGSGKSTLAIQFIAEGVKNGEPGVIALFEETPPKYLDQAKSFGFDLKEIVDQGQLAIVYIRPLDLSVDETLYAIQFAIEQVKAKRVVLDSLSGLEAALAPTFKEDYRESLYRLLGALTGVGITVLMSVEVTENYNELRFSPHSVSFLTHDIILQRYVEIEGELKQVITVIKTRGRKHSNALRAYKVTQQGLVIGEVMSQYQGVITAVPSQRELPRFSSQPGLTGQEAMVLAILNRLGQASIQTLSKQTGLRRPELIQAIKRLLLLNYADKIVENHETIYLPVKPD